MLVLAVAGVETNRTKRHGSKDLFLKVGRPDAFQQYYLRSCFFFVLSTAVQSVVQRCAVVVRRASWILTQRHLLHYGRASKARVKGRWASTLPGHHRMDRHRWLSGRGRRQARALPLFGSLSFVPYTEQAQNCPPAHALRLELFF